MQPIITQAIKAAADKVFASEVSVGLSRPTEEHGDFSTNIALNLAKPAGKRPREIAEAIAAELTIAGYATEVAGPGFINIRLSDQQLWESFQSSTSYARPLDGKTVVVEYSDPNPFKVLHAGHLYTSIVGDSIANLLEAAGAKVHRVNFGGDIGLHVAKNIWAVCRLLGGENPDKLAEVSEQERPDWLSQRYVEGNQAYEQDDTAKQAIDELNQRLYKMMDDNDHVSPLAKIYWITRQWSYDYFDRFYARIGTHFEKYYPESENSNLGLAKARELIEQGILQESDGAVIFKGEDHGLHTRVFINSAGLPTYETKDLGLILAKWRDYQFDKSVVITGNDIIEYMKVVVKVVEQFQPELAQRTTHLTHGMVKLQGGQKMSSRQGNVLKAADILDATAVANIQARGEQPEGITLGAIKYAFLKQRMGGDLIYDSSESVSLEGNSGPYLQYAHARACSILRKAGSAGQGQNGDELNPAELNLNQEERSLARQISLFPEVIAAAVDELLPSHICTYLFDLAQIFNRFYEHNRVAGDQRQGLRSQLVDQYRQVLADGLKLLGIEAPEHI